MKTLTLADKTTLQVEDVSTLNELVIKTTTDKASEVLKTITADNLKVAALDKDPAREVIFTNGTFDSDGTNVTLHFFNRDLTNEEKLQRRVSDLEDIVATMSES